MDNYRKNVMQWMKEVNTRREFFVFDTETTGLKPLEADIIEFSAIKYDNAFNEIGRLDVYINNGYPLPEVISELTGITDAEIAQKGIAPAEAASKIRDFLGERPILAGYNSVLFDTPFCEKLFSCIGPHFEYSIQLDVLKMAREKCPKPHKLADMVAYFNIPEVAFHRSIEDCAATIEVLKNILPLYEKEEPKASMSGFEITGVKRWTKSDTLDRLYVSNNQNRAVYYDIANKLWVTDNLPVEDIESLVLQHEGKNSLDELIA